MDKGPGGRGEERVTSSKTPRFCDNDTENEAKGGLKVSDLQELQAS